MLLEQRETTPTPNIQKLYTQKLKVIFLCFRTTKKYSKEKLIDRPINLTTSVVCL